MSNYYGLFDPIGQYGLVDYAATQAVTLTGSKLFRDRAFNLFASFGGESNRGGWVENRPPVLRASDRPDTQWFCLPRARIHTALRLFLYGQLYPIKGLIQPVLDEEGDQIDSICTNEDALMEESSNLATQFMTEQMVWDYSAIPQPNWVPISRFEYALSAIPSDWDN